MARRFSMDLRPPREVRTKAWVDVAKGAAIIMVVYYHATLYLQHEGVQGVLGRAKAAFELFPMPAFILIAGLFSARVVGWSFAEVWRRKLLPLIYLYVVWSVLRAIFYLAVPGTNGELGELPATNILSLALIFVWPSSSYWFIYALFLFTFALWAVRRVPPLVVVIVAGAVSTLFTSGLVDAGNVGWNRVGALAVFFVAGALYSGRIFDAVQRSRPVHLIAAAVVLATVSALVLFAGLRWLPFLALIGQIAAVAFGFMLSKYLARMRQFGFLSELGTRTLKLYLIHLFVIALATAVIRLLNPDWPRWLEFVVLVSVVLLTIVASLGIARVTAPVRWLYVPPQWLTRGRSRASSELSVTMRGVPTGPVRLHEEGKS